MDGRKIYIISKTRWEYNDQTYDDLGSEALIAFSDKESALKKCRELNDAELKLTYKDLEPCPYKVIEMMFFGK